MVQGSGGKGLPECHADSQRPTFCKLLLTVTGKPRPGGRTTGRPKADRLHFVMVVRPGAVGIGEKINALPRRDRSVSLGAIRCPLAPT